MTVKAKKGLGRGLSALIPDADMEFLSRVARGEVASTPIHRTAQRTELEVVLPSSSAIAPLAPKKGRFRGATRDEVVNTTDVEPSGASLNTFPPAEHDPGENDAASVPGSAAEVERITLDQIEANPYQPRRTFNPQELEDLSASIREHGVLQPILLRPAGGDKPYQLVAGERRWRAARLAGLEQVPAIVREVGDQQALELALIENVQRHDISPLDAALAYKRLSIEFHLSQEKIAARVGKGRVAVANAMRLLDLPDEAQRALEDGTLSEGHGRAILIASSEGARRAVFRRIVRDRLSVRDAEHLARETTLHAEADGNEVSGSGTSNKSKNQQGGAASTPSADLRQAQNELQRKLGARLQVRPRARGGQIIVDYADAKDFERLFAVLMGRGEA